MTAQDEFDFNGDDDGDFGDEARFGVVRAYFADNVDHGLRCPLCAQFAKRYRRKLNKRMIKALRLLVQSGAALDFVHAPTVLSTAAGPARDPGMLALFNLVEELQVVRDDGGRAGYWRVTEAGLAFLRGKLTLPKYALVYDGRRLGYTGDPVSINTVAPEFRLDDLMGDK